MMFGLSALVATVFSGLPSGAENTQLWKDIHTGMSYAQVQALHPAVKGKVHHRKSSITIEGAAQIGSCKPDVTVYFNADGRVRAVWLGSRQRGFPSTTCATEAETALLAKYGEPTARRTGDDTYVWQREGMLVRFQLHGGSDESWTIIYQAPTTADV